MQRIEGSRSRETERYYTMEYRLHRTLHQNFERTVYTEVDFRCHETQ